MAHTAVILAAGKGVRMKSNLPKVVHKAAGKPLVAHVADAVRAAGIEDIIIVVGHGREEVQKVFAGDQVKFVTQEQQLGTGHAPVSYTHLDVYKRQVRERFCHASVLSNRA